MNTEEMGHFLRILGDSNNPISFVAFIQIADKPEGTCVALCYDHRAGAALIIESVERLLARGRGMMDPESATAERMEE